jgi:hypothetical protein
MGILQKYIEDGSKYKSLEFGKDQPEGGSSNQPFIKKDINTAEPIQPGLVDFPSVLRGGANSVMLAITDVERLTKYFKTPNGIQFALNQNLLSRLAPRTEASRFILNEGIYTPLSTLAQAGVGNLGVHLNKQGLDPTGIIDALSIRNYGEIVYKNNLLDPNKRLDNRLVDLHFSHIEYADPDETNVLTYTGGPGSILGIGSTKIKFATKADGITPLRIMGANGKDPKTYLTPGIGDWVGLSLYDLSRTDETEKKSLSSYSSQINQYLLKYNRQLTDNIDFNYNDQVIAASIYPQGYQYVPVGGYSSKITLTVDPNTPEAPSEKAKYLNIGNYYGQKGYLSNINKSVGYTTIDGNLVYDSNFLEGIATGIGPDFRKVERKIRGFVDPKNTYDYVTKTYDNVDTDGDYFEHKSKTSNKVLDRIYYTSDSKRTSTRFNPGSNDIIPFRIGILNQTTTPITKENISFKAYIDNLSDSYDASWSDQTYMGRGEKLYKYNSFGRTMSLGFTAVAEGHTNLISMYASLNKLASSLAPTYTADGYMAGNIHKLTIGNYVHELYGIITGFTYDIDNESPWEIGGEVNIGDTSYENRQLPMFIKVTGFKFTPIHNFRPEYNSGKQFINMGGVELPPLRGNSGKIQEDIIQTPFNNPFTFKTPTDPGITSTAFNDGLNPVVFR